MSVSIPELRRLLAEANRSEFHASARLSLAAVNALPALLAAVEATAEYLPYPTFAGRARLDEALAAFTFEEQP